MKKVYLLFMAIMLTLSLQSCLHDDKTTFDLPAADRIEKKVADYKALLESADDGWVMQYYTGKNYSYGGYTLLLKFKNGNVTAMGDVKDIEAQATSGYDVVKDLGPTLSFNGYNAVIHPLAETLFSVQQTIVSSLKDVSGTMRCSSLVCLRVLTGRNTCSVLPR